jgi:hypothetical protein
VKLTIETLQNRHRLILGKEPSETALLLYPRFPGQHGFGIDEEPCIPKFEATVVLALAQAFEDKNVRVVFFVPKNCELWAIDQFKAIAKGMFGRLKAQRNTISKEALESASNLFKRVYAQVMIGSEPTKDAPPYWVAYGFMEFDPQVPYWLREGLL